MFFDQCIMENEELLPAWRAAHQEGVEDEENLSSICTSIKHWVKSEDGNPQRRLSLRSAAVLVAGGAKLCMKRCQSLLEESRKLDRELTSRRKRPRHEDLSDGQTGSENSDISSHKTPEKMMGWPISYGSTHITYRKRFTSFEMSPLIPNSPNVSELNSRSFDQPSIHQPAMDMNPPQLVPYSSSCITSRNSNVEEQQSGESFINLDLASLRHCRSSGSVSKKGSTSCSEDRTSYSAAEEQALSKTFSIHGGSQDSVDTTEKSRSLNRDSSLEKASKGSNNAENFELLPRPSIETKDESTQTDQADTTEDSQTIPQFYEELPFSLILIHDNFHSRLPSKILCASLNADVRTL